LSKYGFDNIVRYSFNPDLAGITMPGSSGKYAVYCRHVASGVYHLVFRGTPGVAGWIRNFTMSPEPFYGATVMTGFASALKAYGITAANFAAMDNATVISGHSQGAVECHLAAWILTTQHSKTAISVVAVSPPLAYADEMDSRISYSSTNIIPRSTWTPQIFDCVPSLPAGYHTPGMKVYQPINSLPLKAAGSVVSFLSWCFKIANFPANKVLRSIGSYKAFQLLLKSMIPLYTAFELASHVVHVRSLKRLEKDIDSFIDELAAICQQACLLELGTNPAEWLELGVGAFLHDWRYTCPKLRG
jgi:Mn2+/Fe2+ NRAMP family transporter